MITGDAREVFALAARLDRVSGQVGAEAASALRKTAGNIEKTAKSLAPVRSGRLRDSISTDISGDGRFTHMEAEIGPTAEYGIEVEYGTSDTAPEPFMRPAFERHVPEFERVIERLGGLFP